VRNGADGWLPNDPNTGAYQHTLHNVHVEMLIQICRDYAGLPDPRDLTLTEIRWFYDGLRPELKRHTTPKK
jgi:hypothetical protein